MRVVGVLGLTGLLIASCVQAGDKLYRYRNADGNVVVDYQVPAEYIPGGYEVINDEGVVLTVVPRELNEQEKKEADAQKRLEEEAAAEAERLREWDESLLLRYSTVADIEAARERSLDNQRIRLSILKGNRRSLKQTVENLQAEAAQLERAGREVDDERLKAIKLAQEQISNTESAIAEREEEIEAVSQEFQLDIERFEQLQDMVELRRTLSRQR